MKCVFIQTLLLISALALAPLASAQKTTKIPIYPNRTPGVLVTRMWDWTTDAWNADPKPYQQARQTIDQAVSNHQDLSKLSAQYQVQAHSKADSPLALFRWAYTAYQVMITKNTRDEQHQALDGIHEALYHTPSGHTYEYARIQFLVIEFYTSHQQAVPVAKRLLKVQPDDYRVEYDLAGIYLDDYPAKIADALKISEHLKQLQPKKAAIYALTGKAYILLWYRHKNPADAQEVVKNYQKYLQLAPPNSDFRKPAQRIVKDFQAKASQT